MWMVLRSPLKFVYFEGHRKGYDVGYDDGYRARCREERIDRDGT